MRAAVLAAFVALAAVPARAEEPRKVENPWKALPVGTVLEFRTTHEETGPGRLKREEVVEEDVTGFRGRRYKRVTVGPGPVTTTAWTEVEVWTLVSKDEKAATIEVTRGSFKTQRAEQLAPVDALPEPTPLEPDEATHADERATVSPDRLELPFGIFECIRVARSISFPAWDSKRWLVAGFPTPVREYEYQFYCVGPGHKTSSRTLVRFDVPGASWADFASGTSVEIRVEREHRVGSVPATETSTERWTLLRKDEKVATFEVEAAGAKSEKTLPLAPGLPTGVLEPIDTPRGTVLCTKTRVLRPIVDGSREDIAWRAFGYPLPVRTRRMRAQREMVDTETRTLAKFTHPK